MAKMHSTPEIDIPENLFNNLGLDLDDPISPLDLGITADSGVLLSIEPAEIDEAQWSCNVQVLDLTLPGTDTENIRESDKAKKYALPTPAALAVMAFLDNLVDGRSGFSNSAAVKILLTEISPQQRQEIRKIQDPNRERLADDKIFLSADAISKPDSNDTLNTWTMSVNPDKKTSTESLWAELIPVTQDSDEELLLQEPDNDTLIEVEDQQDSCAKPARDADAYPERPEEDTEVTEEPDPTPPRADDGRKGLFSR